MIFFIGQAAAVLFVFGFIFTQLQAAVSLLLRSNLAKTKNSSPLNGYSIGKSLAD
jgi:hypothetical protein